MLQRQARANGDGHAPETQIQDARIDIGKGTGGERVAGRAGRRDGRRFPQLVVSRRSVPVDSGAAPNYRLLVLAGTPCKTESGLEFVQVVLGRHEAVTASDDRRQKSRLGNGVVIEPGLGVPGYAIVDGEIRPVPPRVLEECAELIVMFVVVVVIGSWKRDTANAHAAEDAAWISE